VIGIKESISNNRHSKPNNISNMHVRKRATAWSCEVKKKGKRTYKGGFKTKKAAQECGAKLERKK
jgi:hypothetical protein